ncbi:MAG: hypothetical protein HY532_07685 [Chloroflexi bacterium]|nr:hypothetical protein [Chloroflexota bacterium]
MYSSLIGMVEKAQRYAQERDRISVGQFSATIRGENDSHQVSYEGGAWRCTCDHFLSGKVCSHTMTMERVLNGVQLTAPAVEPRT